MSRIDVGGNRAGTQTGYTGVRPQRPGAHLGRRHQHHRRHRRRRLLLRLRLFEEVFLGVAGQGAKRRRPGVQSNFLGKSGGNKFSGDFYVDGYNNCFQGSNLSEIYTRPDVAGRLRLPRRQQRSAALLRRQLQRRRPIKKDKAWWNFSWRRQFNAVEQPLFTFDQSFDTWNQNPSAKVTYQLNQKNKIIGYYQWNMKEQPNRLPFSGYTYDERRLDDAAGVAELGLQG
jgi:hypothetical protein